MRARRIECKGAEIMKRQAWKRMQAWLLVVAMLVSVVTGIGTTKTAKAATKMGVTYTVHVQTYGDQQGWVHDGTMAGTKGQAKRLEEIRVKLTGDEYSGSIQYKTHIQSYGWQDWSYNGEKSGSRGQAKRLEAWAPLRTEVVVRNVEKCAKTFFTDAQKKLRTKTGQRYRRFLGGLTCQGFYFLDKTPTVLCKSGYVLQGENGLAPLLLENLENGFLAAGYTVVSCPDPIQPKLLAHLLVPELELAFVTGAVTSGLAYQTIHTESLAEKNVWQENRVKLREMLHLAEKEQQKAIDYLKEAKACHDTLEELYHPYVDFKYADQVTEKVLEEILALPDQPLATSFFL